MAHAVLDRQTLSRTLLARQWLHPRRDATIEQAVGHLVAVQAQSTTAPYPGLWSRLTTFDRDELGAALTDRRLVRMTSLRGTVHLTLAADAGPLRAWAQPSVLRALRQHWQGPLAGIDPGALAHRTQQVLADGALRPALELGRLLQQWWPQVPATELTVGARSLLPLVQVPPRGVWGSALQATYTPLEHWVGESPPVDPGQLVRRYLAAFGPASVADLQAWAGLTRLAPLVASLPDLVRYSDEQGRTLYDVAGLALADGAEPLPPILLAPFDNLTLSHADRSRVVDDEHRRRLATSNGMIPGMVLLDGRVAGAWRAPSDGLELEPFRALTRPERASLHDAAVALAELLGVPASVRVRPT